MAERLCRPFHFTCQSLSPPALMTGCEMKTTMTKHRNRKFISGEVYVFSCPFHLFRLFFSLSFSSLSSLCPLSRSVPSYPGKGFGERGAVKGERVCSHQTRCLGSKYPGRKRIVVYLETKERVWWLQIMSPYFC